MPRYRVGEGGVRILPERGAPYSLPPGTVLEELPDRYEGTLDMIETDGQPKTIFGYGVKVISPYEDKS